MNKICSIFSRKIIHFKKKLLCELYSRSININYDIKSSLFYCKNIVLSRILFTLTLHAIVVNVWLFDTQYSSLFHYLVGIRSNQFAWLVDFKSNWSRIDFFNLLICNLQSWYIKNFQVILPRAPKYRYFTWKPKKEELTKVLRKKISIIVVLSTI